MAIEDYFNTEFKALISDGSNDGMGGKKTALSVDFAFMGIVDLIQGYRMMTAGQYAEKATHILLCPIGTAVNIKHVIDDGISQWRILNIDNPTSRGHHLEVLLEYIGLSNV